MANIERRTEHQRLCTHDYELTRLTAESIYAAKIGLLAPLSLY
jgi:hypothetical protein